MNRHKPFEIKFANGRTARAVHVQQQDELIGALRDLGLAPRPTLVVVGGAAGLGAAAPKELHHLFAAALAPLAQSFGANVIDGATDSGVIQLMGGAREEIGGTFPLIGVAAIGNVALPGAEARGKDTWQLEPHHTHFVLVPGSDWGDEVPWISRAATLLARGSASLTILVNGGEVAWDDVEQSIQDKRPVIVVGGSGRTADILAAAVRGDSTNARARGLIESGFVRTIDLADDPREVVASIKQFLSEGATYG